MSPRDISGKVLGKPLRSPYGYGAAPSRARWLWLLPVAWLLWAGVISDHSLWRISQLRRELSIARHEMERVKGENSGLAARLADPREKSEHTEAMLRAQGMARPNEIIYRFDKGKTDSTRALAR